MSTQDIFSTQNMTREEANQYINLLFDGYLARKRKNELYKENDPVPRIIIETYYRYVDEPKFDGMWSSFKRKYIINENDLEQVHEKKERQGLGVVYDYLQNDIPDGNYNIYMLLTLHSLLYSKVDYPEVGGKFRKCEVYLPGTGIDTYPYNDLPSKFQELYFKTLPLFQRGLEIGKKHDVDNLLDFIDKCIELHVELIHIHPFFDGNGRSTRALMNLMFKSVNIPPVYVKVAEREEYTSAMNKAILQGDYRDIKTFFCYKICDSIIDLDNEYKKDSNSRLKLSLVRNN